MPAAPERGVTEEAAYLARWQLVPDGRAIVTRSSRLRSVLQDGCPAMLGHNARRSRSQPASSALWHCMTTMHDVLPRGVSNSVQI